MAVKKLSIKEDFNDRINNLNVSDNRTDFNNFVRNIDNLYAKLLYVVNDNSINYTRLALNDGYEDGTVSRVVINGFNKELEKANKTIKELLDCITKLERYGDDHVDNYNKLNWRSSVNK